MTIDLQKEIIYGPVNSRRLGKSLGVNLMPTRYKLCSFNCVYCQYGWTKKRATNSHLFLQDLPGISEVRQAIVHAFESELEFDFITFSGNGESTMHPDFPEMVSEVVKLRDSYRKNVKIALLSNSSGLFDPRIRTSINSIDYPIFKLDAGTEKKFLKINRPDRSLSYHNIVRALSMMNSIYLQTIFFDGQPSNVEEDDLLAWFERVKEIGPEGVQIYTLDRPVPLSRIKPVSREKLQQISQKGQEISGIQIEAFY
jgi:wyosine [tRNA(Phe)-imidazoG37] synthetase (radical SAM superfamily)